MDILNPRRILLVGHPDGGMLDLLTALTGSAPADGNGSFAGLSHALALQTAYYRATVPIWVDEVAADEGTEAAAAWAAEFLQPAAREVLAALGAVVVCFRKPAGAAEQAAARAVVREVGRVVREGLGAGAWDGVCVAVGMKRAVVGWVAGRGGGGEQLDAKEMRPEEWEDVCADAGFEYVDGEEGGGRNEYRELTGIPRLREALEANDWAAVDTPLDLDDVGDPDDEGAGFGVEAAELEREMFGMRRAIYGDDDDNDGDDGEKAPQAGSGSGNEEDEVEKLEAMMLRMQAVQDMGAGMPEEERKRFAVRAVRDMLKTL